MADNDLQITFGADTSGLSAGTNVAKSEVDRLIQAIALLQKTVGAAARDITGELTTAINNMGAQASSAAPRVRQMADAVQSLSHAGASGFFDRPEGAGGSAAGILSSDATMPAIR